jgi:hypothetical protein
MVERIVVQIAGRKSDYFVTGKVVKSDPANKCVFLAEFGDQPIPLVGLTYDLKYHDTLPDGTVKVRDVTLTPTVPKKGQTVLIAREMGTRRLPRCLGVLMGKNWIVPEME